MTDDSHLFGSGKHLLSLINDILDLSKIEAGRMELDLEDFAVAAALGNAMTLIRERAQQHGITLILEAGEELGTLRADQRKLKQILLNLLSNAVKFTLDEGSITVRARLVNETLTVAVTDTGIGIAECRSGYGLPGVPSGRRQLFQQGRRHRPRARAHASLRRVARC